MPRRLHAAFLPLILLFLCGPSGAAPALAADEPAPQAGGMFVAVGYGGFRGWSTDGENWTAERWSNINGDDVNNIFNLIQRDGILLCSGGAVGKGYILRSTDGKHWDEVVRSKWRISGVLVIGDRFLAEYDDHFHTSTDGVKWEQLASAKTSDADGKGYGYFRRWIAGKGVAVFAGDFVTDWGKPRVGWLGSTKFGKTPLAVQVVANDVCGLAFGNGRFVACTAKGQILTSDDGLKFAESGTTGDQHDDMAVRFVDGKFYLFGRHGAKISTDGKNWESLAKAPFFPTAVAPNGVAVDTRWGHIKVAPDGKTFHTAKSSVDSSGINRIIYFTPAADRAK